MLFSLQKSIRGRSRQDNIVELEGVLALPLALPEPDGHPWRFCQGCRAMGRRQCEQSTAVLWPCDHILDTVTSSQRIAISLYMHQLARKKEKDFQWSWCGKQRLVVGQEMCDSFRCPKKSAIESTVA